MSNPYRDYVRKYYPKAMCRLFGYSSYVIEYERGKSLASFENSPEKAWKSACNIVKSNYG